MTSNLSAAERDTLARQDAHYLPLALPVDPGWDQVAAHLRHIARLFKDPQSPSPSAAACAHINALFDRSVAAMPHAPLACKRGCAHCCRQPVLLYAPEAFFLAAHVRERPQMAQRVTLAAQTAKNYPLGSAKGVECAILENDACALYEARPFSCHGFVSNDLDSCISLFRNFIDIGIPQPETFNPMRNLCRLLLLSALQAAGLSIRAYELNTAVAAVLAQGDAERRWLAGEDVLALDTESPPIPPQFAELIDNWSAGIVGTL